MYDGVFKAEMTLDTSVDAATIIYTNKEFYYPHGLDVTLKVDGKKLQSDQVIIDFSDHRYYSFKITD
jgi:hypothetical protein